MSNLGASVHAKDKNQETPLQIAVKNDHTDIIKLLRKAGGNLDVPKQKLGDLISRYLKYAIYYSLSLRLFWLLINHKKLKVISNINYLSKIKLIVNNYSTINWCSSLI